jgi:glycosyltransferase involved in cell wall biosynthesis
MNIDQDIIKTYNVINQNQLVTFALFAYNQEQYIREAIEGAFSQTHEPLEIILSDDCSTDRTFEIMKEMAAKYNGPHDVIVRKNDKNMGTLTHVLTVGRIAKGSVMILAAGDDISLPERSSAQAKVISENPEIAALTALSIPFIDLTSEKQTSRPLEKYMEKSLCGQFNYIMNPSKFHGCASSYSLEFLKKLPYPEKAVYHEDVAIARCAQIQGHSIAELQQYVVMYRQVDGSLSARKIPENSIENIKKNEIAIQKFALRHLGNLEYYKKVSVNINHESEFNMFEDHVMLKAYWYPVGIKNIKLLRSIKTIEGLKYVLPRIFGINIYSIIKRISLIYGR